MECKDRLYILNYQGLDKKKDLKEFRAARHFLISPSASAGVLVSHDVAVINGKWNLPGFCSTNGWQNQKKKHHDFLNCFHIFRIYDYMLNPVCEAKVIHKAGKSYQQFEQ